MDPGRLRTLLSSPVDVSCCDGKIARSRCWQLQDTTGCSKHAKALPQFVTVSRFAAMFQYIRRSHSIRVVLLRVHRTLFLCFFPSFQCFPLSGRKIDLAVFVMSTSADIWRPQVLHGMIGGCLVGFAGAQAGLRPHLQQQPASAVWQQRSLLVLLWQI